MKYDAIIIGCGPAGLQAALYTCRAGRSTLIIGRDSGALERAALIENFFGQAEPVSGTRLLENTRAQLRRLGASFAADEIFHIDWTGSFLLTGKEASYEADTVLLATGSRRARTAIEGLDRLDGRGVSWCAVCDAFFYRGRKAAVLGSGDYAVSELAHLTPVVSEAYLLTNGQPLTADMPEGVEVLEQKIVSIDGAEHVEGVTFADGSSVPLDGLFVALGSAGAFELARKAGALTEGNRILTDGNMATNVPGLFAAGDCTGGLQQIAAAVGEGAKAGMAMNAFLRGR